MTTPTTQTTPTTTPTITDGPWRLAAAVLVLAGGAVHVSLAFDGYGSPDLIDAFYLNGAVSAVVAAWLVLSSGVAAPLAGLGLTAGSLIGFGLSRIGDGTLGFRATGLDPSPEAALTLMVEVAALVALALVARTAWIRRAA